jgi:hypothetical protein
MTRKRKAEREADDRRFRQQSGLFTNPYVQRAHFHAYTDHGVTVTSSVLSRSKLEYCGGPTPGVAADPPNATGSGDDKNCDRRTQASFS